MNSHLLTGKVRHLRLSPTRYGFEHDVFYIAADVGELEAIGRRSRLLAYNGRAPLAILDRDHFSGAGIAAEARAHLPPEVAGDVRRITMIAYPRVFGHVFNPITWFLCHDGKDELVAVLAEVHNTHRERHVYPLLREGGPGGAWRSSAAKRFFVSPFIGPEVDYAFAINETAGGFTFRIDATEAGRPLFLADARLQRRPLTDGALARVLARYPLVTLKTIGLIHYHALRLWLRRVPVHHHGAVR